MARPPNSGPTHRELTLLKLLWQHGPSTIRQLLTHFPHRPKPAHTSLQTNLQGMLEKGYVTRVPHPEGTSHVYHAAITQDAVEQYAVTDLIRRVFDGSAVRMLTAALTHDQASPEELVRLQTLLDEHARG